jgi:hypothetical protein
MNTITDPRAAKMGYTTPPPKAARHTAASPLHARSAPGRSGSHDFAIASTFDRLEANCGADRERRAQLRTQRTQLATFLPTTKVTPQDTQELLSIHLEHVVRHRSSEARAKRWAGPAGYESLCIDAGSKQTADAQIAATNRVLKAIEKVAPGLAQELAHNGAAEHPSFIKIAAKYGEVAAAEAKKEI